MNEDEIRAQLLSKLTPNEQPNDAADSITVTEEQNAEGSHTGIDLDSPLLKMEVFDILGITLGQRKSPEANSQVAYILNWANEQSVEGGFKEVVTIIAELKNALRVSPLENGLTKLYRYAKLSRQKDLIERQMRSI